MHFAGQRAARSRGAASFAACSLSGKNTSLYALACGLQVKAAQNRRFFSRESLYDAFIVERRSTTPYLYFLVYPRGPGLLFSLEYSTTTLASHWCWHPDRCELPLDGVVQTLRCVRE